MHAEHVHVGHKYFTKADNLIEIVEEVHMTRPDGGPTHHYCGRVLRTIHGHENLMGRVQRYDIMGRWLNSEGNTVAKCIHDLKEEACHAT